MYNSNSGNFRSEYETGNLESAYELSPEYEFNTQPNLEYSSGYSNEYLGESAYELSPEFETGLNQNEYEIQLSNELMQVSNEYEFGAWLKRLAKRGAGIASNFLNSPTGQQITSSLGNIAQRTLSGLSQRAGSWLGQRVGSAIGGDIGNQISQFGTQAGQQLGQMAADRVPAFVRFASDTLRNVSNEINTGNPPQVKPAIVKAAAKHYPIILKVKGTLYAQSTRNPNYQATSNEFLQEDSSEASYESESDEYESAINEINEMELASELLSVKNDYELDMFLGKLFNKVKGAVSNFAKSGIGKSLGGMLKSVAGKALPLLGGALGSAIPIPGVGTMLGSALGSAAGNLFGLEMEGLSGEDREFETARAFVRLAGDAARRASRIRNMAPKQAARYALIRSARTYAPGLIRLRRPVGSFGYNTGYAYAPPPVYGNVSPAPVYGNTNFGNQGMSSGYPPAGSGTGDIDEGYMDMDPGAMDMNGSDQNVNPESRYMQGW